MRRQLDLFCARAPAFDAAYRTVERIELGDGAWVDHARAWVAGHDVLFEELERGLTWRQERMHMYDRVVVVPRLLASIPPAGAGQPLLEDIRASLSARYGEPFVRTTAALYRDGRDSVAFHGDTTARDLDQALVATISLGAPRRFHLRPAAGGTARVLALGGGDLVVMGGTAQRTWRHGIPKVAVAGPRIAVMFRPPWGAAYDDPDD